MSLYDEMWKRWLANRKKQEESINKIIHTIRESYTQDSGIYLFYEFPTKWEEKVISEYEEGGHYGQDSAGT